MQKLNYPWNKRMLFLCTCAISSVSLKGFLSHHHSCSCLCLGGWLAVSADDISRDARLCWNKPPTRTSRTPPSDAPSRASKARRLLQKLLSLQNRACCAAALPKGSSTELDSCSCHPVSKCNSCHLKMWWMQRVTAAVQEMGHSCTSVPQDHLEEKYQK